MTIPTREYSDIRIKMEKPANMRSKWFEHVAKTRKKISKKGSTASHQEAMKAASVTWAKEKIKIEKRLKKEEKARLKAKKSDVVEK